MTVKKKNERTLQNLVNVLSKRVITEEYSNTIRYNNRYNRGIEQYDNI